MFHHFFFFFFHLMIFFVCCKDFWSDQSHGTYSLVTLHFTLKPRSLAGLDFRPVLASPTKPKLSRSLSDSPEVPTLQTRNIQVQTADRRQSKKR